MLENMNRLMCVINLPVSPVVQVAGADGGPLPILFTAMT